SPRGGDLVPYTLAEATRSPVDPTNPFDRHTTVDGAFGADLGLGITSKLTLNATINPDFGQGEADPSEVNLTASRRSCASDDRSSWKAETSSATRLATGYSAKSSFSTRDA